MLFESRTNQCSSGKMDFEKQPKGAWIEYKVAQSLGGLIKKADESVQTVVGSEIPVKGLVSLSKSLSGSA